MIEMDTFEIRKNSVRIGYPYVMKNELNWNRIFGELGLSMDIPAHIENIISKEEILWVGQAFESSVEGFAITGDINVYLSKKLRILVEDVGGFVKSFSSFFGGGNTENKIVESTLDASNILIGAETILLYLNDNDYVVLSTILLPENVRTQLLTVSEQSILYKESEGISELEMKDQVNKNHTVRVFIDDSKIPCFAFDSGTVESLRDANFVCKYYPEHSFRVLKQRWVQFLSPILIDGQYVEGLWCPVYDDAIHNYFLHEYEQDASEQFSINVQFSLSDVDGVRTSLEGQLYLFDDRIMLASEQLSSRLAIAQGEEGTVYFEDGFLYVVGPSYSLLIEVPLVYTSFVQNNSFIYDMTYRLQQSPDLLAAVWLNEDYKAVSKVRIDDKALSIQNHFFQKSIQLQDIVSIEVDSDVIKLFQNEQEIRLFSSCAEIRDLADEIWQNVLHITPQMLSSDFVRSDEHLHLEQIKPILERVPEEAILTYREEYVDKSELPDMIGKAILCTSQQLPLPYNIVQSVSKILRIKPPACYVYDKWECVVDVLSYTNPRIEISSRCLTELSEAELTFQLARACAHISLGHLKTEMLGEEMLRILQSQEALKGEGLSQFGSFVGGGVGLFLGGPIGAGAGSMLGNAITKKFSSEKGIHNPEGEVLLHKILLFQWFRTAVGSVDAFGYLYTGDLRSSITSILMSIFNNRMLVESIVIKDFIEQGDKIEGILGDAAMYSRLDEVLPYGPQRIGNLLSYAISDVAIRASSRMKRLKEEGHSL